MADTDNYCACTGGGAQYTIKLNQQGPPGPPGPQGETGPRGQDSNIKVLASTNDTYVLQFTSGALVWNSPNLIANVKPLIDELDTKLTEEINTTNTKVEANTINIEQLTTSLSTKQNQLVPGNNINIIHNDNNTDTIEATIPQATTSTLGGVKVDGTTITINEEGVISGANQSEIDKYINVNANASLSRLTFNIDGVGTSPTKRFTLNTPYSTNIAATKPAAGSFPATTATLRMTGSGTFYLLNTSGNTETNLMTINSTTLSYKDSPVLTQDRLVAGSNITLTKADDGTTTITAKSSGGGGTSSPEKYGIQGDYSTHYGILDCPNGLIDYNATGKDIKVNAGIVLQCPNKDTRTTLASELNYTIQSTGDITLFYAGSEFIEAGQVFYQTEEPEGDGVDNYQAWFNPELGTWQFRSNDTGNVFRSISGVTPLANIRTNEANILRIDYIGYRILDDDILVQQSEVESLQELIATQQTTINDLLARIEALETNINGGNA